MCPLVNVDQGQYSHHRVHRDVQSKEVESGGTVVRRCDEVGTENRYVLLENIYTVDLVDCVGILSVAYG